MRKVVSILVLVSMLVMLFSACAKPAPTPAPPAPTAVPVEEVEEEAIEEVEEPTEELTEEPEPFTLTWWTPFASIIPAGYPTVRVDFKEAGESGDWIVERFRERYPQYDHVSFEYIYSADIGGWIAPSLDALIAAGEAPNIMDGYGGRLGAYVDIAVNMDDYLDEEQKADYIDYDAMVINGKVPMLNGVSSTWYFILNGSLIERACAQEEFDCAVPEPWSIASHEQFLTIGEAIKALGDGSYLGCLYGQNPSGQHLNWLWLAQVGVGAFDGQHNFTGINTLETRAVLTELFDLYDDGQFVPGISGLNEDDCFDLMIRGRIAFYAGALVFHNAYVPPLVDSGEIDEVWEVVPILGVQFDDNRTPMPNGHIFGVAGMVTITTPEEQRKAAVDFINFVLEMPFMVNDQNIPTRHSHLTSGYVDMSALTELAAYVEEVGRLDNNIQNPHYNELRQLFADQLSSIALGLRTPTEALFMFEQIGKGLVAE